MDILIIIAIAVIWAISAVSFYLGTRYHKQHETRSTVAQEPHKGKSKEGVPSVNKMTEEELEEFHRFDTGFRNIMLYDGKKQSWEVK